MSEKKLTWGANTVHTFGPPAGATWTPQPAPSFGNFGSPSPANQPAPALGNTLFGNNAPASGGSSLFGAPVGNTGSPFGNTPAPGPFGNTPSQRGLFGSSTPAPSTGGTGLFGNNFAPAGGTGLFGGTPAGQTHSSSLFGSPANSGSLFGNRASTFGGSSFGTPAPGTSLFSNTSQPQQQQQQYQQIPAQAAILGYMDAHARQEEVRVRTKLEKLFLSYTGQVVVAEDSTRSANFVAITYNPLTPEERQMRMAVAAMGGQQQYFEPPRPLQVCRRDWKLATVNNPDPNEYTPVALVGATSLQGRISWQQDRATTLSNHCKEGEKTLDFVRRRASIARQRLLEKDRKQLALKQRLLDVMKKVEIVRSFNKPFQPDEYQALQRLQTLLARSEDLQNKALTLQHHTQTRDPSIQEVQEDENLLKDPEKRKSLEAIVKNQGLKISKLSEVTKKDRRDVNLVYTRVNAVTLAGTTQF